MAKGSWPTWEESRRRRERAIELRKQGLSYKEIRSIVGGSSASMSLWLRDIPVPPEHRARLRRRQLDAVRRTSQALRQRRLDKEARIRGEAALEMGKVTSRDLFIAGVVAYAAEGAKQKPWSPKCATQFINSDPRMILLFVRWLKQLGVRRTDMSFRVAIHETAAVQAAEAYWSRIVGVPSSHFLPTTLKKGHSKTVRRNIGPTYRGCLVVNVRRSSDLTRRIDGWFDALVDFSERPTAGNVVLPRPELGARR